MELIYLLLFIIALPIIIELAVVAIGGIGLILGALLVGILALFGTDK